MLIDNICDILLLFLLQHLHDSPDLWTGMNILYHLVLAVFRKSDC